MAHPTTPFFDYLDSAFGSAPTSNTLQAMEDTDPTARVSMANGGTRPAHEERCLKCGGTGYFTSYSGRVLGPCFTCKGKGKKVFKTSQADRTRSRTMAADRKARQADAHWAEFQVMYPAEAKWLEGTAPRWELAASLLAAARQYGALTDKQMAVVTKGIARDAERAARPATPPTPVANLAAIEEAFAAARANGAKRAKLRYEGLELSLAKESSRNPGAIYVTAGERYLGKVVGGTFTASRDCTDADRTRLLAVAADPRGMAIAYGMATICCSCCGITLTDPVSRERGIGPICETKFGWTR